MNNLTTREKAMAFGILLILIIFLVYFFGIRILNDNYKQYKEELKTLQDRKAFLDELKTENAKTEEEIKQLNANIEKIEMSFIDKLETEVIEQYLLNVFEKNECPFMSNVDSSDVTMTPITLADGSSSDNAVLCREIEITYVTTDGFLPTIYNGQPDFKDENGIKSIDLINEAIATMGSEEFELFYGYNGFLKSLKQIADENKDCIKVVGIKAESTHGYMTLTATVDFYGATFTNRVSIDNNKAAYTWWSGNTNIDTKGGFIGRPYLVENEDSLWHHTTISAKEVLSFYDRPFTPWVINAYFTKKLQEQGTISMVTNGIYAIGNNGSDDANNNNNNNANGDDFTQASDD